jgi:FMN phosphatase YigB (HAD superfamily)
MGTVQSILSDTDLFVFDCDQTLAQTHKKSPSGLTVELAYARLIDEIFETCGMLDAMGGLANRAPGELIEKVLRIGKDKFVPSAKRYYALHKEGLSDLVPFGKGLDLDVALAHGNDSGFCTELLVRAKLKLLNQEQGVYESGMWPAPYDGVRSFLETLGDSHWAIMSSGHDTFITCMLRLWDVSYPEFMVTDDDVRGLSLPVQVVCKPSGFLFDFLFAQAAALGHTFERARTLLIGDDPEKDGKLAKNSRIKFLCYNPEGKALPGGILEFRHWDELTALRVG